MIKGTYTVARYAPICRPAPKHRAWTISLKTIRDGFLNPRCPFRFKSLLPGKLQKQRNPLKIQWISLFLVRSKGLEPPRCYSHGPQPCASAYSATTAYQIVSVRGCPCVDGTILILLHYGSDVKSFFNSFSPPHTHNASCGCRYRCGGNMG